jgi:hypothetical protein
VAVEAVSAEAAIMAADALATSSLLDNSRDSFFKTKPPRVLAPEALFLTITDYT